MVFYNKLVGSKSATEFLIKLFVTKSDFCGNFP